MRIEKSKSALSEINVTPLVDVMLVLLIIFMITAPLLKQGLDIDLPKAKGKELSSHERLVIALTKNGDLRLNDKLITMAGLIERIRSVSTMSPEAYLEADKDVPYGEVVKLMAEIKEAGIEKLGMITEPRIETR